MAEARKAAEAAGARFGFGLDWVEYDLGADRWLATGEALPDAVLEELREVDAILLGAVGRPDVPRGAGAGPAAPAPLRARPLRELEAGEAVPGGVVAAGRRQADDIDLLVVRENTEGVYVGAGGTVHRGGPAEAATETSIETRAGVERCLRFAAAKARERAGRLTLVHKTNVLVHAGDLWQRAARAVAEETGVALDYAHADAACLYLVNDPGRFDVIVTDNLFGDILTDLGAAIAGGLGTAASANLNPTSSPPCSNPCTGRRPTSPAPAGPTRWPPYSRPPCSWTTWGSGRPRPRSSRGRSGPARGCGILDPGARGPDRHRRRGRRVPD